MKTDLHIHTCCSTGTQTPEEAIQEAVSKGIGLISFTDDDTTDAYQGLAPR
jgi:predicted metal-dependent phosphoesterase TrpH